MSAFVQTVWEVYDDRLQFMAVRDGLLLEEALQFGHVSPGFFGPVLRRLLCWTPLVLLVVPSRPRGLWVVVGREL